MRPVWWKSCSASRSGGRVERWIIAALGIWIVAFPSCANAQRQAVSRSSQVVLIARLPDAFTVQSQDVARAITPTAPSHASPTLPAAVEIRAIGRLIPGTSVATACLASVPRETRLETRDSAFLPPRMLLGPDRKAFSAAGRISACDGSFRNFPGSPQLIAIEARRQTSSDGRTARRVDIVFSIL